MCGSRSTRRIDPLVQHAHSKHLMASTRMKTKRPSSALLPPRRPLPDLVAQQNARITRLEALISGSDEMGEPAAAGLGGKSSALVKQQLAAEEAKRVSERDELFESGMYAIERKLSQFVCPSNVYVASRVEGGLEKRNSFRKGGSSSAVARQRASSERLYQGGGVKVSAMAALPARLVLPPTGKRVNTELNALRSDPKAREALRLRCEQHLLDMHNEKVQQARGHGDGTLKNFLAENVKKASRPRSAPPKILPPGQPEPMEERPEWRPGGAPIEMCERPGSPPRAYGRPPSAHGSGRDRPQSAAAASRPIKSILKPSSPTHADSTEVERPQTPVAIAGAAAPAMSAAVA